MEKVIAEWGYNLVFYVQKYAPVNPEVDLFQQALEGELTDDVYMDQKAMRDKLLEYLVEVRDLMCLAGLVTRNESENIPRPNLPANIKFRGSLRTCRPIEDPRRSDVDWTISGGTIRHDIRIFVYFGLVHHGAAAGFVQGLGVLSLRQDRLRIGVP